MMGCIGTRSSSLMVLAWLLTLGVWVQASRVKKFVQLRSDGLNETSDLPFDAEQYKEYLTNLKCQNISILHDGVRIPEVATGTIYQETMTFQPTTPLDPLLPNQSPPPAPTVTPLKLPNPPPPLPWTTEVPITQQTKADITGVPRVQRRNAPAACQPATNMPTITEKLLSTKQPTTEEDDEDVDEDDEDDEDDEKEENGSKPDYGTHKSNGTDTDEGLSEEEINDSSTNGNKECTAPLSRDWVKYNWYQILLDHGGPPGWYLQNKELSSNLTEVDDPCSRPITQASETIVDTKFGFSRIEFEKVYRMEEVEVQFPGTPLEFLDISGKLVWSPPDSKRRYYHLSYRKDDTGLYFTLDQKRRCVFTLDFRPEVSCHYSSLICDCENGKETCHYPLTTTPPHTFLPPGLSAALVGGGR